MFSLLGVDFLLGAGGEPYLIEFSKAPGIRDVPPFLGEQNRALMRDALDRLTIHTAVAQRNNNFIL